MSAERRVHRLAVGVVVGSAAIGPFWTTYPALPLAAVTLGRVALLALAGATVFLLADRAPRCLPPARVLAFLAGVGVLWAVVTLSAATRGCFCSGAWSGYSELAALAGLLALCLSVAPELRGAVLVAVMIATTVSALLGLLSITDIHASTVPVRPFAGRIGGPYGNPNFLGFSVAVGVPIASVLFVRTRKWRQLSVGIALLIMVLAIAQTYSRGAIVAAAAGTLVALTSSTAGRRRQIAVLVAGVLLAAVVTLTAYSSFDRARTSADIASIRSAAAASDRNGWDGNARGLIAAGPSSLGNPMPAVLAAATGGQGRGLSFDLGYARAGQPVTVGFDVASSSSDLSAHYGMEDDQAGLGAVIERAMISPRWQHRSLTWRPTATARAPRFYLWQAGAEAYLRVRSVAVRTPGGVRAIDLRLRGSTFGAAQAASLERRYVDSRVSAARLALRAFAHAPLVGIGWQHFAPYAKARDPQGALATHDEYIRILAELGLLGFVPLLVALGAVAAGAVALVRTSSAVADHARPLAARTWAGAVAGGVVTAAIGLTFVNGLDTPAASSALAVVVAAASATSWQRSPAAVPTESLTGSG